MVSNEEEPIKEVDRENQAGVDRENEREDDEYETPEEEAQRIKDEAEQEDPSPVINERILKLTGSVNLEDDLPWGTEFEMIVRCSLVKTELKDNQDGSFDKVYKTKLTTLENIIEV